jgi:DNA replication protein DnaC
MEANKRGFKGVWLCAAIYESPELSAVEKLLLAEIDALTSDVDACYATNTHFSDRLGVTVTRVDHLLGKLTRLGYIVRVSFDGRVTRRVVAPEYSSNPGHSIALIGDEQRQSRSVKNNRAALSRMTKQDCRNEQGSAAKNSRAPYIKEIPEEIPNLETTTTTYPDLDNEKSRGKEATEALSSRRFFVGEESSESLRDRNGGPEAENSLALVDQLVREYGLSGKQRQAVSEYRDSRGEEYVRSKAAIVRAQPRRNAAGALLAALRHIKDLLDQGIGTLVTPTNIVISASTRAATEFDFRFETFGEKKLREMLAAAQDFVRDMATGAPPRWLSLLGRSGTGKTHLARGISRFFKAEASIYIDRVTGAHLSRQGGFIGWRKIVDQLRNGEYGIMDAVCNDWFVALDDIGAERASDFSVSKLDQIIDARLGKWTVITCNFTREEIAEQMDVRIASRLGRANNVIVDNISVLDYSIRSKEVA